MILSTTILNLFTAVANIIAEVYNGCRRQHENVEQELTILAPCQRILRHSLDGRGEITAVREIQKVQEGGGALKFK
jgi:hypothetical protein